jgi:hypothetical protein
MQFHRIEPHLYTVPLGLSGKPMIGRKKPKLGVASRILVKHFDRTAPIVMLVVVDLTELYAVSTPMCQRKIMLAAAMARASAWLSNSKGAYKNADPWNKRAILFSLRVLPKDEKKFWLKSVAKRVDGLNALIVDYITQ